MSRILRNKSIGDLNLGPGAKIYLGEDANGIPAIITSGSATDDTGIKAEIGAATEQADGSLYISVVDGAGLIFIKKSDTWTEITT